MNEPAGKMVHPDSRPDWSDRIGSPRLVRMYIAVIVVEVLVLIGLWFAQEWFS